MSECYQPEKGELPRGTVIVVGGRGESAVLYSRFATKLCAAGYTVNVFGDVTDDLPSASLAISNVLADRSFPEPKVLIGSDTGALLAMRLGMQPELGIDGIVVAGVPASEGPPPRRLVVVESDSASDSSVPALLRAVEPHRIDAPVLALHGQGDSVAPVDPALEIYRAIPHSEIVMIDSGEHHILDGMTDRTAVATIVAFLERVEHVGLDSGWPTGI